LNSPNAIIKEIKILNWNIPILGEETLMAAIMVGNFPPDTEGVMVASVMASFDETDSQYQTFKTKFNQKFNKNPLYPYYQAISYDTIHLINLALKSNYKTSDQLKNYFEHLPEYRGASGQIELAAHERTLDLKNINLLKVSNGAFIPIQ